MLAFHVGHHSGYEILEKEEFTACGSLGVEGWALVRKTSLGRALCPRKNLEEVEQRKGQPTHTLLIPIISFRLSLEHTQGHSWWTLREDRGWWSCGKLKNLIPILLKYHVGQRKKHFRQISSWAAMLQPLEGEEALSWESGVWVLVLVLSFSYCDLW